MVHFLIRSLVVLPLLAATAALAAGGDAAKGHDVFHNQCAICHSVSAGAPKSLGPNLFAVVGRAAGTLPGFNYSPAMKASGLTWTDATLEQYLPAPAKLVPGTRMTYGGLKNHDQLEDVIAYLNTVK